MFVGNFDVFYSVY